MKKFFILFAATCIASAAWSDAVYEPLIISSGFNRDVIAEVYDPSPTDTVKTKDGLRDSVLHQSDIYAQSYYITGYKSPRYSYPTVSALRQKYSNLDELTYTLSGVKKPLANTAFPDDNGGPEDRRVNCLSSKYPGLYWILGEYDVPNALCIRKGHDTKKIWPLPDHGKFEFKNIGCYQKLFFAVVAGGFGSDTEAKKMHTKVYYSNGEPTDTTFNLYDHGNLADTVRAFHDNILNGDDWERGDWKSKTNCFAAVCEMGIDQHRLIDSIVFTYQSTSQGAGIAILAVTGKVANIAAPDANPAPHSRAPMRTSNITSESFDVEWDEVSGAASYRLDVATDEDFHHMVGGYNNMMVNGTSAHVDGLNDPDDHEYYWRVRSVDASGGQSASSAPRKTVLIGGATPSTHEEGNAIETDLQDLINVAVPSITITRTLYKDGDFNTLCLPFDLSAEALAASPIAGCELYEFVGAKVLGSSQLDIEMRRTNDLVAGVPYLLKWPNTNEVISELVFHNVTITKSKGDTIIGVNDEERTDLVRFIGNLDQELLGINNKNYLFLGAANTLYWPNDESKLKGFRAYFDIPSLLNPASSPVRQGMPARIVLQEQVTTGVENTSAKFGGYEKHLENGQLVIIRDNIRYNVMGLQLR